MSKVKKSTKKFAQKKAQGAVQFKKHKHGHKKSANGLSGSRRTASTKLQQQQQQQERTAAATKSSQKQLEDMDLDEFLDGGFELDGQQQSSDDEAAAAALSSDDDSTPLSDDGDDGDDGDDDDDVSDAAEDEKALDSETEDGLADHLQAAVANVANWRRHLPADSSGDDDGEEEAAAAAAAAGGSAAAAVAADNKRLKGAVSRHKQQLEALREKDPEFYQYLQASDAGLLGFGEGEDDDDLDDDDNELSESEEDEDQAAGASHSRAAAKKQQQQQAKDAAVKKKAAKMGAAAAAESDEEGDDGAEGDEGEGQQAGAAGVQVTSSMVEGWCTAALEKASLGSMMQLVKAYRVACHYGDTEQQLSNTLTISSGAVFNRVLLFMLKEADGIFRRMLGLQPDATTAAAATGQGAAAAAAARVLLAEQVTKAPRWKKVEPLVKSYLGNSLHLLSSMTQPDMTSYALRRLRPSVAFFGSYPRLTKKLLKLALELFGSADQGPRLQALLLVRQMGLVLPPPALQSVLRGAYRAYASNAKFVSPATLPALTFMDAGVVELSTLDPGVTYEVGFVAIRELAVLLRNALAAKTQDAHKEVYCWQTLFCMELWVKVLSAAGPGGTLQPLVYPLVQLLLAAARLVPTPRYFPIRLRLVRALNRLSQAAGVYIPVSPLLLEMLQWSELHKTPTGGAAAAPDLLLLLRLSKTQLKTASLQEEVVQQVLELLADHLVQWATSVSFPEAVHLPLVALRGFMKQCAVERFRRAARQLVEALERNIVYVGSARDGVSFAPQDLAAASRFLAEDRDKAKSPLVQFAQQLLQKAQARMAMRSAATKEMQLDGGAAPVAGSKRSRQQEAEEADSEEEVEGEDGQEASLADLLAVGAGSEEGEDEQALAGAAKKHIRQKEKQLKRAAAAAAADKITAEMDGGDDETGDKLAEYELSDDDDNNGYGGEAEDNSEEEQPGSAVVGKGKRAKQWQHHSSRQGGHQGADKGSHKQKRAGRGKRRPSQEPTAGNKKRQHKAAGKSRR